MGIGAKSLYAAFGSKDDLFTQALHHYVRKI
jgi:AcrR family transcriptional regulator